MSDPRKGLMSPLNIAGYVAWAAIGYELLFTTWSPPPWLDGPTPLWVLGSLHLTFLAMFATVTSRDDLPVWLGRSLLLVAQGIWSAWRAIRDRRSPQKYFGPVFWTLTGACVTAGAAMIWLGLNIGQPIFAVFGGVGGVIAVGAMKARRRADSDPVWWLREHYSAMIGNGVATHIAFFSIGLRHLLPGLDPALLQNLAWFTPLAVAAVAGWWIGRKYGGKKAVGAPKRGAVSSPAG